MAITVNTNMAALNIQSNLNNATNDMNKAMLRMSTGSKINSAADDAAGLAVSTQFETTISSNKVAQDNAQIGSNLLTTAEGTLDVIKGNLQRIRDLAEQAANGTYSTDARTAMQAEVEQRVSEINRVANGTDFNGINLFNDGATELGTTGLALQIGTANDTNSTITVTADVFKSAEASALMETSGDIKDNLATSAAAKSFLDDVDKGIKAVTDRQTKIGAYQNRLSSASENLTVQSQNLTASNSTIKDADVAVESAKYVQSQILQKASASLLASANQSPSIALSLIG